MRLYFESSDLGDIVCVDFIVTESKFEEYKSLRMRHSSIVSSNCMQFNLNDYSLIDDYEGHESSLGFEIQKAISDGAEILYVKIGVKND